MTALKGRLPVGLGMLIAALLFSALPSIFSPETAHAFPVRCNSVPGSPVAMSTSTGEETLSMSTSTGEGTPAWAVGWDEEWDWSEIDPAELGTGLKAEQPSEYEIQCGGFKPFTQRNFRYNVGVNTRQTPAGSDAHHTFPVKFESWFAGRGMNIHTPQYGTWWAATPHRSNASAWNSEWQRFIDRNPKASTTAIKAQGRLMLSRYGLRAWF